MKIEVQGKYIDIGDDDWKPFRNRFERLFAVRKPWRYASNYHIVRLRTQVERHFELPSSVPEFIPGVHVIVNPLWVRRRKRWKQYNRAIGA